MATTTTIYKAAIWQNGTASLLARVKVIDKAVSFTPRAILQADISAITYTVYGTNDIVVVADSPLTPVSTYVYDTLQTGDAWPYTPGFNFFATLPASRFATAGVYRVVVKITLVSLTASPIFFEFLLTAQKT